MPAQAHTRKSSTRAIDRTTQSWARCIAFSPSYINAANLTFGHNRPNDGEDFRYIPLIRTLDSNAHALRYQTIRKMTVTFLPHFSSLLRKYIAMWEWNVCFA